MTSIQKLSFTTAPEGPPQHLQLSGPTSSSSLMVEWAEPAIPNGVITNYLITWSSPDDFENLTITHDTNYTLTGLLPCTTYTVSVSASTIKGYGPFAKTNGTTQPAGGCYKMFIITSENHLLLAKYMANDSPKLCMHEYY